MKSTRVRRIVCDVGSETDGVFSAGTKAKLSIYLSIYLSASCMTCNWTDSCHLLFSQINKT